MHKNEIKVVVSDLDGTLINSQDQMPQNFKEMVSQLAKRGIIFVAASGRGVASMENKLNHQADNFYIISDNGAIIKHKDQVISDTHFSAADVEKIINTFKMTDNTAIIASTANKSFAEIKKPNLEPLIKQFFSNYEIVEDILQLDKSFVNVCMYSEDNNDNNYNHQSVQQLKNHYSIVRAGDVWVDAMPQGINKGVGLRKLLEHLNVDPKNVIAFGDYHNDIELLKTAHIGYAMENAHPDVQEIADEIIGNNDNNSVIKKIYQLLDINI